MCFILAIASNLIILGFCKNLPCTFQKSDGKWTCVLSKLLLLENTNETLANITIVTTNNTKNNSEVLRVIIKDSTITFIPYKIFLEFPNLAELEITEKVLSYEILAISSKNYLWNEKIKKFNLSRNSIKRIETNAFIKYPGLNSLDLQSNKIAIVKDGAFNGLKSLTYLDLENNVIEIIRNSTFYGLENLKTLSLRINKIKFVGAGTFTRLNNLESLLMNQNAGIKESMTRSLASYQSKIVRNCKNFCKATDEITSTEEKDRKDLNFAIKDVEFGLDFYRLNANRMQFNLHNCDCV